MKNHSLTFFAACLFLIAVCVPIAKGQLVPSNDVKNQTFQQITKTNQPHTTASSVQMLTEMLQQLPADLPHCAQNFDTFGILATGHLTSQQPLTGWNAKNSLAFKRGGQLTFDILEIPLEGPATGSGYKNYRVFVEGGQVCVSQGNSVLARNIQVQKISATAYYISWYTPTSVVTVTFVKKKDSIIC